MDANTRKIATEILGVKNEVKGIKIRIQGLGLKGRYQDLLDKVVANLDEAARLLTQQ